MLPRGELARVPASRRPSLRFPLRAFVASVVAASLVGALFLTRRAQDASLTQASIDHASGAASAPFLALAILGAMSGLVLLVAFRPAK